MIFVNYSGLRQYLKRYLDTVVRENEVLAVERQNGETVIAMSLKRYNDYIKLQEENIRLLKRIEALYRKSESNESPEA